MILRHHRVRAQVAEQRPRLLVRSAHPSSPSTAEWTANHVPPPERTEFPHPVRTARSGPPANAAAPPWGGHCKSPEAITVDLGTFDQIRPRLRLLCAPGAEKSQAIQER